MGLKGKSKGSDRLAAAMVSKRFALLPLEDIRLPVAQEPSPTPAVGAERGGKLMAGAACPAARHRGGSA